MLVSVNFQFDSFLIVARRLPRPVPLSSPAERVAAWARRARRGEARERARVGRVVCKAPSEVFSFFFSSPFARLNSTATFFFPSFFFNLDLDLSLTFSLSFSFSLSLSHTHTHKKTAKRRYRPGAVALREIRKYQR